MTAEHPFRALTEEAKPAPQQRRATGQVVMPPRKSVYARLVALCARNTAPTSAYTFFFGGLASVVFGAYEVYHPLGPIVGGAIIAYLGFVISEDIK